jgi:hypothetical protein
MNYEDFEKLDDCLADLLLMAEGIRLANDVNTGGNPKTRQALTDICSRINKLLPHRQKIQQERSRLWEASKVKKKAYAETVKPINESQNNLAKCLREGTLIPSPSDFQPLKFNKPSVTDTLA